MWRASRGRQGLVQCTQPRERQLEFDILGSPSAQIEIEGLLLRCPAGEGGSLDSDEVPSLGDFAEGQRYKC